MRKFRPRPKGLQSLSRRQRLFLPILNPPDFNQWTGTSGFPLVSMTLDILRHFIAQEVVINVPPLFPFCVQPSGFGREL
jgi:hypothetical protein